MSAEAYYTPIDQIAPIVDKARKTFESGVTKSLTWRKQQLRAIVKMFEENRQAVEEALHKDLRQIPFMAALTEIDGIIKEAKLALSSVDEWVQPESKDIPLAMQPGKGYVIREPLGVVLNISPWNYPFRLLFLPLIGAIAAGNCCVCKPSEVTVHSMILMSKLFPQYLDTNAIPLVNGGPAETTAVLKQKFDHIFYTGNGRVGKIVMRAAAEHLTPVTLELGGKSPTFVDKAANLDVAAKRICFGKFMNVGQTCVAPDYVLVDKSVEKAFLAKLKGAIEEFYGATAEENQKSKDLSRVVNTHHLQRLAAMVRAHPKEDIVYGGHVDVKDNFLQPTILKNVSPDAPVMSDEIFGPILPVLAVNSIQEGIDFVNSREKPLALYVFSGDKSVVDKVLRDTSSGCASVNDCVFQVACPDLPFGGVGASGTGNYNGRSTFETLSHHKSVLDHPTFIDPSIRYPPYNDFKTGWFSRLDKLQLPKPTPGMKKLGALAAGVGLFALRSRL